MINASSIPGRILPNYFADHFGPFNTIIPSALCCTILIFALLGISSVAGIFIFAILFGFGSGAYLSLAAPCVASMAQHPSEIGIRFGLSYLVSAFGALTGTPINGALLQGDFQWWKPITFSGVSTAISVVIIVFARNGLAKRKGTNLV